MQAVSMCAQRKVRDGSKDPMPSRPANYAPCIYASWGLGIMGEGKFCKL